MSVTSGPSVPLQGRSRLPLLYGLGMEEEGACRGS